MNSSIRCFRLTCLVLSLCASTLVYAGGQPEAPQNALDSSFYSPFSGNLQKSFEHARHQHKQVLLVFGAKDCHYCEQMRQHVYTNPQAQQFYQQHYLVYALDIDDPSPMLDERGQATTVQDFAKDNRIRLTPTLIYFDHNQEGIYRQTGYIIDPKAFISLGQSLLTSTQP